MTIDPAMILALRELIATTERRDAAEVALTQARQSNDPRQPLKPASEAQDQARAFLLANLQHGAALAHARNVLVSHDDRANMPPSPDEIGRIRLALHSQGMPSIRRACPSCAIVECNGECMG